VHVGWPPYGGCSKFFSVAVAVSVGACLLEVSLDVVCVYSGSGDLGLVVVPDVVMTSCSKLLDGLGGLSH